MEEQFRTHMTADAGVAAIAGERVVWGARPQGETMPCIVLHRITGTRDYHMRGRSRLVESLVQIDCWADTWLGAKGLARAAGGALDTLEDPPFQKAFITSERDSFETDEDGRGFHRTMLETRVWHEDAF